MTKVTVVRGVAGLALYINDQRVAGPKPWGGGTTVAEFTGIPLAEVHKALAEDLNANAEKSTPEESVQILIAAILRDEGRIHGNHILDLLIEHANGRYNVDSYDVERIIDQLGLIPEDETKPAPTLSQVAFLGLQYSKWPGYVPGTKACYWFRTRG